MDAENKKMLIWGIALLIIGLGSIAFAITNNVQFAGRSEAAVLWIPLAGILMIWQAIKNIIKK